MLGMDALLHREGWLPALARKNGQNCKDKMK